MNTNNNNNKCPGFEELSAYFDGELDSSSPYYAHIADCDKCRIELDAYKKVNVLLKKEFLDYVPDNFSAKMIDSIKRRREKKSRTDAIHFGFFMKIAALFIISGVIVFALVPHRDSTVRNKVITVKSDPLIFLDQPIQTQSHTNTSLLPFRQCAAGGSDSIDIRKMINVSTGISGDNNIYIAPKKRDPVAIIHTNVKQVWSVNSLKHVETEIAQLAEGAKFSKSNSSITMTLELSKKNLANFVRSCKNTGFRLLSPSQPQPEQTLFGGNQNDRVLYTATFVKAE